MVFIIVLLAQNLLIIPYKIGLNFFSFLNSSNHHKLLYTELKSDHMQLLTTSPSSALWGYTE